MILTVTLLILGFIALVAGAEFLVRGASRLAAAVGISSIVIGLTVVAFGTSTPELAVSVMSAFSGSADIAIGNAVGSNIFNILLILGISALIVPLVVSRQFIRADVPIMIGVAGILWFMSRDGVLGRGDGIILLVCLFVYVWRTVYEGKIAPGVKAEGKETGEEIPVPSGARGILIQIAFILVGLALLVLGSRWLVQGAVVLARYLGVGELIIGLTVVAAGTSLPEVATSVVAGLRGERDIAVGNVVGSNIFNILGVLGAASTIAPAGVVVSPVAMSFDIPVMIAASVLCLPIFLTGGIIARWEGAIFLGYYMIYTAWLILASGTHAAFAGFRGAVIFVIIPLTLIALTVSLITDHRTRRSRHSHHARR